MIATEQSVDSLLAALSKARIPVGNHEFIRRLTSAVGIVGCRAMAVGTSKPYVLATRRDGRPGLHIYHGYTNGFATEDEIVRIVGTDAVRALSSRKGTWDVAHPEYKVRPGAARSRDVRREAGFCDCGMQLSLTGKCSSCE
jgi:hypothetical protein